MKQNNELHLILLMSIIGLAVSILALNISGNNSTPMRPIIYKVDSEDSQVLGRVEKKTTLYDQYQLIIDGNYFDVTQDQYKAVNVGDVVYSLVVKGE